jgi:hypothetical protein
MRYWRTSVTTAAANARVGRTLTGHTALPYTVLIVYTKAKFDNLPAEFLAQLKQGVEDAL